MARSVLAAICVAAAMFPATAFAQKAANTNEQKQLYCRGYDFAPDHSGQAILTSLPGGRNQADLFFLYRADPARARFAGGQPLVTLDPDNEDERITPSIGIWYRFTLGASGQPDSDVLPVAITVTGGDFLDAPGDLSLYKLHIDYGAGGKLPVFVPPSMFEMMNDMIGVVTSVATPPQQAYETVAQADLDRVVQGMEGAPRAIVIERGGREIANLPIADRPVAAERDKMFGWIRSTLPLLKDWKCPES
ncbi:MAG: hypothetical protein KF730_02895 [Sphingomonas sp.]|uniref:hypothetical protein n=1 Tax=Sphingomonas sp. TaxID=28214 RepID=UPI0025D9A664|nr:hypothetical protein [Sphingomonas sp.]MBX3563504.1 hypothetical protein [Sphingomonas sp.]